MKSKDRHGNDTSVDGFVLESNYVTKVSGGIKCHDTSICL